MIKAGLTGGIGSGKTTAARILSLLGVPVYDSDSAAKSIMERDGEVKSAVIALLGGRAYCGGKPDRKYIAERVFSNGELLGGLNRIVHPAVRRDFRNWVSGQTAPYVVMESAILVESGFADEVDMVVLVTAPEDLRTERAARRDSSPAEAVRARIAAQMPDRERELHADYILRADEVHLLVPQILELDKKLREYGRQNGH